MRLVSFELMGTTHMWTSANLWYRTMAQTINDKITNKTMGQTINDKITNKTMAQTINDKITMGQTTIDDKITNKRQTHHWYKKRSLVAQFVSSVDSEGVVCVAGNSSPPSITAEPFPNCQTKTILITAW